MALDLFDPVIRDWFAGRYGAPTEIQRLSWGPIAAGRHILLTAPTGSGKTLTAFLWAIERLATGAWEEGATRVVYVSPLKALNSDIHRNLEEPLAALAAAFETAGRVWPRIRVATRSGDTTPAERQRQLRQRPEILITTPESLNLLVNSRHAPEFFAGLRTVILDEIHAVAGTKRGTHLITAVDRMVRYAGDFQRVALSATVRPLERVAAWVGGYHLERGAGGEPRYRRRAVAIVSSRAAKRYDIGVRLPPELAALEGDEREGDGTWKAVAADLRRQIGAARSTLVFTNSRRLSEKLTRLVNDEAGRELAWSHHGSLARELRSAIESRLKRGELEALVATSSLELGIDIGALDQVLLLQAPRSLASAAQRIGRAGHGVGEVSRARLYPTHARDFLECAVAARAVVEGEIEPVVPVRAPLDLLAQWVVGMVTHERLGVDDLYALLRTSEPYHELSRGQFDLVIEMLAGRYAEARIAELKPRLAFDRLEGTVVARPGAAQILAQSGGTIPDRGYFQLRVEESNARLGELDEEFVWERSLGDTFVLGTQSWRIRRITANEVFVQPARGGAALAPFWRADARDRGALFSSKIGGLLEDLEPRLALADLPAALKAEYALDEASANELVRLLFESREALGGVLPHRHRLVFEESLERPGGRADGVEGRRQVVLYTFWGGTLNRPLALALAAAWGEAAGGEIETLADDDAVLLSLPPGVDPRELLALVTPARLEELLRTRLESSGFFGAHFRQNAQRALLLPRAGPRRRTPLWVSRENAKRLLEAVGRFDDFPLTLETWRSVLHDEFDLGALRERLEELERGEVEVRLVRSTRPSPLAAGLLWRRTNDLMYEDDEPRARRGTALRGDLLREVAVSGERPLLSRRLAEELRLKLHRLAPGYPPQNASELLEWVKERLFLTQMEWAELGAALHRERPEGAEDLQAELEASGKLTHFRFALELEPVVVASEQVARLESRLEGPERFGTLLEEWLRWQVPLPVSEVARLWGSTAVAVEECCRGAVIAERLVLGRLLESEMGREPQEVASRSVVETLLRFRRSASRPAFEPLPVAELPLFLAEWQGLTAPHEGGGTSIEALQASLERLFGYSAPAALWESDLLPARLARYFPAWLDSLMEESELLWCGTGRERITFLFRPDLDLLGGEARESGEREPEGARDEEIVRSLLAERAQGLELGEIAERAGLPLASALAVLWRLAWRGESTTPALRLLRQGVHSGFRLEDLVPKAAGGAPAEASGRRSGRRALFRRWEGRPALGGRWQRLAIAAPGDPLIEEERLRERARWLLDRYGVVFRELLAHELPAFSWARIARALRVLELSGEIVSGRFFDGPLGLQFASPAAFRRLSEGRLRNAVWWCSALDPASPCALDLPGLAGEMPTSALRRTIGTRLAYRGSRLAAVFARGGREIRFAVSPGDPDLPKLLAPLANALTRAVDPERSVDVERINDLPAGESPYREAFSEFESTRDGGTLRLRRRYGAGRS